MPIKRVGRTAAWLTVIILAGVTTLTVLMLAYFGHLRGWPVLFGPFSAMIWTVLLLVALAPWWALVTVALQREHVRSRAR